jgi:REP element-mobilizing transposase RayT
MRSTTSAPYGRGMARRHRSELVHGLSHVTARGNRRGDVFPTPLDYYDYLLRVEEVVEREGLICHGYCLMPNHVHLIFDSAQPPLSNAMRDLQGLYARRFNKRYGVTGHVFENRFDSVPIRRESHLLEVVRYVVLNPVRAGLCGRAEDWPWSSFGAYLDQAEVPPFLTVKFVLELFGADRAAAQTRLAAFVAAGLRYPKPYVPGNFSASSRTRRAPGRPTTFR